MLTEDLQPWLLEVNSSPSMAKSSRATSKLVDLVLEDTLKGRYHDRCFFSKSKGTHPRALQLIH